MSDGLAKLYLGTAAYHIKNSSKGYAVALIERSSPSSRTSPRSHFTLLQTRRLIRDYYWLPPKWWLPYFHCKIHSKMELLKPAMKMTLLFVSSIFPMFLIPSNCLWLPIFITSMHTIEPHYLDRMPCWRPSRQHHQQSGRLLLGSPQHQNIPNG